MHISNTKYIPYNREVYLVLSLVIFSFFIELSETGK